MVGKINRYFGWVNLVISLTIKHIPKSVFAYLFNVILFNIYQLKFSCFLFTRQLTSFCGGWCGYPVYGLNYCTGCLQVNNNMSFIAIKCSTDKEDDLLRNGKNDRFLSVRFKWYK